MIVYLPMKNKIRTKVIITKEELIVYTCDRSQSMKDRFLYIRGANIDDWQRSKLTSEVSEAAIEIVKKKSREYCTSFRYIDVERQG